MTTLYDFISKRYAFYNMNGSNYLGEILFQPDGRIGTYSNPNERSWTF